jgi:hypothetical protein
MDDVPDMRPPRGVIWAIKIPLGRTVSITFDSALKAIILLTFDSSVQFHFHHLMIASISTNLM